MKDSLLKIVDNFIDTVENIGRPNGFSKPRIEISDNFSFEYLVLNINLIPNDVKYEKYLRKKYLEHFYTQYPAEIREKASQISYPKTVRFVFKEKPSIYVEKKLTKVLKTLSLKIELPKSFFSWGKAKKLDAVLNYNEILPIYFIKCGHLSYEIEEIEYNKIIERIEAKKKALEDKVKADKENNIIKIINQRFNEISKE
jgi:hypothetical protein